MLISIVNLSHGALADEELQRVIRAINRQIADDFEPYWSFSAIPTATCSSEGRTRVTGGA